MPLGKHALRDEVRAGQRNGLTRVLGRFAAEIDVDVDVTAWTFRRGDETHIAPTAVWLREGPEGRRIVAIGQAPPNPEDAFVVHLFDGPSPAPADPDLMMELLVRFIQHGFVQLLPGRIFLRPTVRVRGVVGLDSRLGGFQANIVRAAAILAGAGQVVIES